MPEPIVESVRIERFRTRSYPETSSTNVFAHQTLEGGTLLQNAKTMKAIVKHGKNLSAMVCQAPAVSTDFDVLVRVALAGICRTDTYVARGLIDEGCDPLILGHEFSGFVEAIGDGVGSVKP